MTYIHTARLCKVCRFADNVTAPSTHTIVREGLSACIQVTGCVSLEIRSREGNIDLTRGVNK